MEIPEDIGCLSSLEWLDLRGNMFESLPKSIKHLSKLETLLLRDCNMLRSLTELPVALQHLDAINCQQLCQALPDASEFKRCITSKNHMYVNFLFINSFNLNLSVALLLNTISVALPDTGMSVTRGCASCVRTSM